MQEFIPASKPGANHLSKPVDVDQDFYEPGAQGGPATSPVQERITPPVLPVSTE